MDNRPSWLPAIINLFPWSNSRFDELYQIFTRDFIDNIPTYDGVKISCYRDLEEGKLAIFWHITHKDDRASGQRIFDPRRSERLHWARLMLDNIPDQSILVWDYKESSGTIKTYVWLKNYDYLVILKKTKTGLILNTAFYIEFKSKREELYGKYKKRIIKEKKG